MGRFSNISIREYRKYLEYKGLSHIRDKGGHEIWSQTGLKRPVIFQAHIDPVPEPILRTNARTMNVPMDDLLDFLKSRS